MLFQPIKLCNANNTPLILGLTRNVDELYAIGSYRSNMNAHQLYGFHSWELQRCGYPWIFRGMWRALPQTIPKYLGHSLWSYIPGTSQVHFTEEYFRTDISEIQPEYPQMLSEYWGLWVSPNTRTISSHTHTPEPLKSMTHMLQSVLPPNVQKWNIEKVNSLACIWQINR